MYGYVWSVWVRAALGCEPSPAFLVPYALLNLKWSPNTHSIFLSVLLSSFAAIFAVCAIRLMMRWSLHFIECGFFLKALTVTNGLCPGTLRTVFCEEIAFANKKKSAFKLLSMLSLVWSDSSELEEMCCYFHLFRLTAFLHFHSVSDARYHFSDYYFSKHFIISAHCHP